MHHPALPLRRLGLAPMIFCATAASAHASAAPAKSIGRWEPVELAFTAVIERANPYVSVEFWAEFVHENGGTLRRPGFWDGGGTWKVRFAAPETGRWSWRTFARPDDDGGLHGREGVLDVVENDGAHPLRRHGLLRMSPGGRNVVHADGTPFLLVADTPWAIPFRGTPESVTTYARDRRAKGFNAALLMTVQPDRDPRGPENRTETGGFAVAFADLHRDHLNELRPGYFQELDTLLDILLDHGIVPVFSPVFQGFGWKGGRALGGSADAAEYGRFQLYLLARYGASPAMWLPSADSAGRAPAVEPAGRLIEEWDAYRQPTGFHYSPFDDRMPDWTNDRAHGFHHNRMHQDAPWLDFQWAQSGHGGGHEPDTVARMYDNQPPKAVANGEPTYERIARPDNAVGWWQGHEAWGNLVAGGTMGVVYGAAGLWQWKLSADEPGWPAWCDARASWRDALDFEGSRYVGLLARALAGMDFADMAKLPGLVSEGANLLGKPGRFYLSYLPAGGAVTIRDLPAGLPWRWFDPKRGDFGPERTTNGGGQTFTAPDAEPRVLLIGERGGRS